jgi:hypothetical protein
MQSECLVISFYLFIMYAVLYSIVTGCSPLWQQAIVECLSGLSSLTWPESERLDSDTDGERGCTPTLCIEQSMFTG